MFPNFRSIYLTLFYFLATWWIKQYVANYIAMSLYICKEMYFLVQKPTSVFDCVEQLHFLKSLKKTEVFPSYSMKLMIRVSRQISLAKSYSFERLGLSSQENPSL